MSLSRELTTTVGRTRPIYRYFKENFSDLKAVRQTWKKALDGRSPITPDSTTRPSYPTLGTALDYRLRYYFGVTPGQQLVAFKGALKVCGEDALPLRLVHDFFWTLDELVKTIQPVGRKLDPAEEDQLNGYCYVLALFEQIYRRGMGIGSPLFMGMAPRPVDDLLVLAAPAWRADLTQLSYAFHADRSMLFSKAAVLNPTFAGSAGIGGADADIIVGGCLIDFKASINQPLETPWLWQLLGYALLDYDDKYKISSLGIYMARQTMLVEWPISELLTALSGGAAGSLAETRAQFRIVVESLSAGVRT